MKKKQYPPQTGMYSVKVKTEQSTHSWLDFDFVRLQISVGQEYHENEKLKAAIDWCKPRFKSVQICVNDSLQRYNMMFEQGISEEEAQLVAMREGQEWVDRNIHMFSSIPHLEIMRWENWKSTPLFTGYRKKIENLYLRNEEFRKSIDDNIEAIWRRRQAGNPYLYKDSRFQEFYDLSRKYLLEEITVFSVMFETDKGIDVYPGTTIFAATVFQGRQVQGAPEGLGKGYFCRIDFTRNKNYPYLKLVKNLEVS
jgi:tRNA-dependent cyclodipeptide synthase